MDTRFTFVTIGQTPRTDLVPEILSRLPPEVPWREVGALDGMDDTTIRGLAPAPGEPRLVSRLRDGGQVVMRKRWVQDRLGELMAGLDTRRGEVVVLLCTGEFPGLRGPGVFLDAQHLVDHGVAGLCAGARRIGLLLPLPEQADDFHFRPGPEQALVSTHASPYEGDRFSAAGAELADCDLLVMHCMGYTEEQRRAVTVASGRPVLLARRLVAAALAQLL
jgi:protein AroM